MKEFFENWGCLIYIVIMVLFLLFITPKQEIDEYQIELESKIEELEKENEFLKDNYCKLKAEDLYCISYKKERKEKEELIKEHEELFNRK